MQIDYYNAAHQRLHTSYGGEVTARDNDRTPTASTSTRYEAPTIVHVHVSTTTDRDAREFQVVGTAYEGVARGSPPISTPTHPGAERAGADVKLHAQVAERSLR